MREVYSLEFADKQVTETFSFYTEELDEVSITLTAFQIAFMKYGYAKKHNMPLYVSLDSPCTVYTIHEGKVMLNVNDSQWMECSRTPEQLLEVNDDDFCGNVVAVCYGDIDVMSQFINEDAI